MPLIWPFLLGYAADLILGDPPHWVHPVRLIGRGIHFWERLLYRPQVAAGLVFWLVVAASVLIPLVLLLALVQHLPAALHYFILAYFCYAGLATRCLHAESSIVEEALSAGDLDAARQRLARIVGRDTADLSPAEVRRAVLETVAENLSDGVVAPLFYLLVLGIPGLWLYKTANTLDSMVGYKTNRYLKFGRAAARIDDALNLAPARLTAWLMVGISPLLGLDQTGALRILKRDWRRASSPNAGWPEAALAGALGVRLGGPASYFGHVVSKPHIGDPREKPLDRADYEAAIRLLYATSIAMAALTALVLAWTAAGIWGVAGRLWG
jgi:adenosylcobinamide-phosphate synthase